MKKFVYKNANTYLCDIILISLILLPWKIKNLILKGSDVLGLQH